MKYSFSRKISPKRFFPDMQFESAEFTVEDCNSKEEAMKEIDEWIKEWVDQTKSKIEEVSKKEEDKQPFESKSIVSNEQRKRHEDKLNNK